jgi:predicted transcriptional regulator
MGLKRKFKNLKEENVKLQRKFEILEAHGIKIVDTVAGDYEVYDENYRRAQRLESLLKDFIREIAYENDYKQTYSTIV